MSTIEETLAERGDRYGNFMEHAKIAQTLQDVMRGTDGWSKLAYDQKQALTVIADKIARMLNGQPGYQDNWHDIVGYAKLVDDRMAADEGNRCVEVKNFSLFFKHEHQAFKRLDKRWKWIATDLSGTAYAYENKPIQIGECWDIKHENMKFEVLSEDYASALDWKDSLVSRYTA